MNTPKMIELHCPADVTLDQFVQSLRFLETFAREFCVVVLTKQQENELITRLTATFTARRGGGTIYGFDYVTR